MPSYIFFVMSARTFHYVAWPHPLCDFVKEHARLLGDTCRSAHAHTDLYWEFMSMRYSSAAGQTFKQRASRRKHEPEGRHSSQVGGGNEVAATEQRAR